MLKEQKGMTLTMLVLSIAGMLALAAIAIAMVLDELSYDPEPVQVHSEQQVISTAEPSTETPVPETVEMPSAEVQENAE